MDQVHRNNSRDLDWNDENGRMNAWKQTRIVEDERIKERNRDRITKNGKRRMVLNKMRTFDLSNEIDVLRKTRKYL